MWVGVSMGVSMGVFVVVFMGGYCVVFWGVFGDVSTIKRSHNYVSKSCV